MRSMGHYKMKPDGTTEPCSLMEWAEQCGDPAARTIARSSVMDAQVSTVFIGIDIGVYESPPLLFETRIFGGHYGGWQRRHATRAEAEAEHQRVVERLNANEPPEDRGRTQEVFGEPLKVYCGRRRYTIGKLSGVLRTNRWAGVTCEQCLRIRKLEDERRKRSARRGALRGR
jgi:hypothetical protein